jgi:hypothetical protein
MRPLLLALVAACSLLLAGCPGDRKPMPVVTVVVLDADDSFQFNGQQMTWRQLSEELRQLAEHNRRPNSNDVRAIVRLSSRPGVAYDRVRDVEEYCNSIGLDNIEKGM